MIRRNLLPAACFLMMSMHSLLAQRVIENPLRSKNLTGSDLRYVVYLSRHGVRSPTGKAEQYRRYSIAPWPSWPVPPGYLTPHGFQLMELFGAFDRIQLSAEGLLSSDGCGDAPHITIYADSDQRTRETGKAIAKGLMPGCELPVQSLAEGTNDPLFHPLPTASGGHDAALATAAITGRIGGNPSNLAQAYHPQLVELDHILATCGAKPIMQDSSQRISLVDVPATLSAGTGDHLAELRGPLATASTLSENLLLEYAEGMEAPSVGWGCVPREEINAFMTLHTAAVDFSQRTPMVARTQAWNLLSHLRVSLQQAAVQRVVSGAMGKPSDRVLFLVGHDTNQENIAGLLSLNWIIDGRRDDTPPGGALVFELWRNRSDGQYFVRTYYQAQTLEQMRTAAPLTASNPPERVAVFVPGCSEANMSCPLGSFLNVLKEASTLTNGP